MRLRITLEANTGGQITSLVVPLPSDHFLLSPEELSARFVTPYLSDMQTFGIMWAGRARSGITVRKEYGPA
jgi:hypothetical protein